MAILEPEMDGAESTSTLYGDVFRTMLNDLRYFVPALHSVHAGRLARRH